MPEAIHLQTASGTFTATKSGTLKGMFENGIEVTLEDVLFWEGAPNLVSVSKIVKNGCTINFQRNKAIIYDQNNSEIVEATGIHPTVAVKFKQRPISFKLTSDDLFRLHLIYNHVSAPRIAKQFDIEIERDDPIFKNIRDDCIGCTVGNFPRDPIKCNKDIDYEDFTYLVLDSTGALRRSFRGEKGFLFILDVGSNMKWNLNWKKRSESESFIKGVVNEIERRHPGKLLQIKSDNAKEFKKKSLLKFYEEKGIKVIFSTKYVHEENGRAERGIGITKSAARVLLKTAKLPQVYWPEAVDAAIHNSNCIIPKNRRLAPYEAFYGQKVDHSRQPLFGCEGRAHISVERRGAFDDASFPCISLGLDGFNGYHKVLNSDTGAITIERSVKFNEKKFIKNASYRQSTEATDLDDESENESDVFEEEEETNEENLINKEKTKNLIAQAQEIEKKCSTNDWEEFYSKYVNNKNVGEKSIQEKCKDFKPFEDYLKNTNSQPRPQKELQEMSNKHAVLLALYRLKAMLLKNTHYAFLAKRGRINNTSFRNFKEALM